MAGVKLFIFHFKDLLDSGEFEFLLTFADSVQRKKILSFRNPADIHRSLVGFILSRYIGIKYFHCPEDIRMGVGEHGKPFYINQLSYNFNISHSGNWVICAADSKPVGCDVQKHKKLNLDIARRFYHPNEYHLLLQLPEHGQEDYFFTTWVLKESYIKALGKGFTHGMKSYYFDTGNREDIALISDMPGSAVWNFSLLHLDPSHKCALCSQSRLSEKHIITLTADTLADFFVDLQK